MWEISQAVCLGTLIGVSAADIKFHKVPQDILIMCTAGALIYRIAAKDMEAALILGGIAVGAMFFAISRVTEEGLGYGDSWMILNLGIYLGLWGLIEVLAGAFALLFIAGVVCIVRKKTGRKTGLPFFPFLAAAYMVSLSTQYTY